MQKICHNLVEVELKINIMKNIFDLVTEPKFKKILEAYYNATTDEEREAVLKYQTELQESMTPEELEKFNGNILSSLHNIINN